MQDQNKELKRKVGELTLNNEQMKVQMQEDQEFEKLSHEKKVEQLIQQHDKLRVQLIEDKEVEKVSL